MFKGIDKFRCRKESGEVGKLLRYSNKSSFSQVINGIVNLPVDFVDRLCSLNSTISKDWIRTGNGNVLENDYNTNQSYNKDNTYNNTNESLSSGYFRSNSLPLISAETMIEYSVDNKEVAEASATQFLVPTFKGADYLITVIGSSMYPRYNNGDIVACKHLSLNTFFQWNKVYVINTEQGVLVKRICKSNNEDFVTIVSDNKEYDTFELPKSEILSIAIVTGVIRLE